MEKDNFTRMNELLNSPSLSYENILIEMRGMSRDEIEMFLSQILAGKKGTIPKEFEIEAVSLLGPITEDQAFEMLLVQELCTHWETVEYIQHQLDAFVKSTPAELEQARFTRYYFTRRIRYLASFETNNQSYHLAFSEAIDEINDYVESGFTDFFIPDLTDLPAEVIGLLHPLLQTFIQHAKRKEESE